MLRGKTSLSGIGLLPAIMALVLSGGCTRDGLLNEDEIANQPSTGDAGDGLVAFAAAEVISGEITLIVPEDATVECDEASNRDSFQRWRAVASAVSDCAGATLSDDFESFTDGCGSSGRTHVTWTASDDCGNEAAASATFAARDTTGPIFVGPEDLTVECGDPDTRQKLNRWLNSASAVDACGEVAIENDFEELAPSPCGRTSRTLVTWTATDSCGNKSRHQATFSIVDTTPPSIQGPADLTVDCDAGEGVAEVRAWLADVEGDDGCGAVVFGNDFESFPGGCGPAGSTLVTWSATDECGNRSTHQATLTVIDTTPPVIQGPDDFLGVCEDDTTLGDFEQWLRIATGEDACTDVTLTHDFVSFSESCDAVVTWTVTDACGLTAGHSASVSVTDETPPEITLNGPAAVTLECNVERYRELGASVSDACDVLLTEAVIGGETVDVKTPGTYTVVYSAIDACGNEGQPVTREIEVVDTLPPELAERPMMMIWPPNHEYHEFQLSDCPVVDRCEGELDVDANGRIISIYSDEPENDTGDGNTPEDIVITSDSSFRLRAERQGGGNGRVYGIRFEIADSAGNAAELLCRIGVPHDQSGRPPTDDGARAGYVIDR